MSSSDHLDIETCREWVQLELDGELGEAKRRQLAACRVADPRLDAELKAERRQLERLDQLLASSRVAVGPELKAQVMKSLPAAGWQARHPKSWRLALAVLAVLAGASAMLVGQGSAQLAPDGPFVGALAAVWDLFATAVVTGVGLLALSWKGVGLALSETLTTTGISAFALAVVGMNLLFLLLLRGSRKALAASWERSRRR